MSQQGVELAAQLLELQADLSFKYGVNLAARSVQLIGEIDEGTFILLDSALTLLENDSKAGITIKLNSTGGSVYDALAVVGRIKASKCKITIEAYGACMSAATLIFACGDKRRISKYAWLMHHEVSAGFEGGLTHLKTQVAQLDREHDVWSEQMAEFTKAPAHFWKTKGGAGNDFYITPKHCLDLGLAEEIF